MIPAEQYPYYGAQVAPLPQESAVPYQLNPLTAAGISMLAASQKRPGNAPYRNPLEAGLSAYQGTRQQILENEQRQQALDAQQQYQMQAVKPAELRMYEEAVRQGYQGTLQEFMQEQAMLTYSTTVPSAVREYQFFSQLAPEQQDQFLGVKRASPWINLGNQMVQPNLLNPLDANAAYQVGLAPGEQPAIRAAQAGAEAQAKAAVELDTAADIESERLKGRGEEKTVDKTLRAKSAVTDTIVKASSLYDKLEEFGGAVDPNKSFLSNIKARAQTSAGGQLIGGALGTEVQAIVDEIETIRPTLINHIRSATGMSAKAMDSERELQFYLQAVSDPSRSLPSARAALRMIDQQYGTNLGGHADPNEMRRLKEEYLQSLKGRSGRNKAQSETTAEAAALDNQISAPKTQEEYESLPSGALFVDPDDGKTYRKP